MYLVSFIAGWIDTVLFCFGDVPNRPTGVRLPGGR